MALLLPQTPAPAQSGAEAQAKQELNEAALDAVNVSTMIYGIGVNVPVTVTRQSIPPRARVQKFALKSSIA